MDPRIAEQASRLPNGPGVYLFTDAAGQVLYVGKAADLRARVRSYLKPGGDGRYQLRFLAREARGLECIATATEQEALLLENTVIKKQQPRYNLKLKDDKSFLLLRLDRREAWPWFRLVRRRFDDGAQYFGPFASAKAVRRTLRLVHKVVPLRDCGDHAFQQRQRPCLKHQLGRCPAPCVGLVTREAYDGLLDHAVRILRGEVGPLLGELRTRMQQAAETLQFERAQVLKEQMLALQSIAEPQTVVAGAGDADAVGLFRSGDAVAAAFLSFRGGALDGCRRYAFRSELPDALLVGELLAHCYAGDRHVPPVVLLPVLPDDAELLAGWLGGKRGGRVELQVPQRGTRRRHLELAQQNAALADALATDAASRRAAGAARLGALVGLPEPPERLHCLDVSTIQGTSTVASRVCFVDGAPHKAQYRRFKITREHAGDDFAAMQEAVRRSLGLCLERDDEDLPDLLVVDGGRGQLDAARRALAELGLPEPLPVVGLAKSRLRGLGAQRGPTGERLVLPDRDEPVPLADGAPETLLLAALRDEAHRFAIGYHRQVRGRLGSEIDAVPGVGPARRRALLRHFGSLSALRAASLEQLQQAPGVPVGVAAALFAALHEGTGPEAPDGPVPD
ncbi:MAG: excinuclease ABC subunit UvrC [Planctomycetes bacterium]|nr:excinuclease ABC subunit UvrC [Planctomycetota bacterium]